jgi:uncharacterized FlaG/YvyC family protein
MEVGNIPRFEQFENVIPKNVEPIQKIKETQLLNAEVKNRNIDHPELIKELAATKKAERKEQVEAQNVEFVISNVNFGYNPESKDFYVKVNRGDYMTQYPTDEMMKLKAYLMHLAKDENIA